MDKLANRSLTIRLEPEIFVAVERIAQEKKWSLGHTIRELLGEYLPHRATFLKARQKEAKERK
jgi:hypothetical protein